MQGGFCGNRHMGNVLFTLLCGVSKVLDNAFTMRCIMNIGGGICKL